MRTSLLVVRSILISVLAAAALSVAVPRVSAGSMGWNTTTAVVPGGTLTIDVNAPNVNITASTIINTCPITGLNTDIIIYTCDVAGPGIPAGTNLAQSWADPPTGRPLAGPFSEKVTYNANGALAGAPAAPTPCTQTSLSQFTASWSCQINVLPTHYPQSMTVYLLGTDQQSLVILGMQGMEIRDYLDSTGAVFTAYQLGTCPFDFGDSTPTFDQMVKKTEPEDDPYSSILSGTPIQPTATFGAGEVVGGQQWDGEIKAVYICGESFEKIPRPNGEGSTLSFDVGSSATASVDIAQSISYSPAPTPTTQTIFGSPPPVLTSINPTSGPAGSTVTLTGTNLTAFTVTFGGSPGRSTPIGPSAGSTVSFSGVPATDVTCSSATSCTATVPTTAAANNQWNVTLTTSEGTSNALTFMTTAPPAPAASTPGP